MMKSENMNKHRGFSLIEVLVAVLILAIGLLGVAALQMTSLNSGQDGYFRTQATAIGEDLASRIVINAAANEFSSAYLDLVGGASATAVADYLANYVAAPYICPVVPDPEPPPGNVYCRPDVATGNAGQTCTAMQIVAFDMWEVCKSARDLLPNGNVVTVQNGNRMSIAVGWQAVAATSGGADAQDVRNPRCVAQFAMTPEMDCVVVEAIP